MPLGHIINARITSPSTGSVRHGFYNLSYSGLIEISIRKSIKEIIINIKDNGIGRNEAQRLNTGRGSGGRGLNVMEEQISLFNRYNYKPIVVNITDLEEDGSVRGTEVTLTIPENYNFNISSPLK